MSTRSRRRGAATSTIIYTWRDGPHSVFYFMSESGTPYSVLSERIVASFLSGPSLTSLTNTTNRPRGRGVIHSNNLCSMPAPVRRRLLLERYLARGDRASCLATRTFPSRRIHQSPSTIGLANKITPRHSKIAPSHLEVISQVS